MGFIATTWSPILFFLCKNRTWEGLWEETSRKTAWLIYKALGDILTCPLFLEAKNTKSWRKLLCIPSRLSCVPCQQQHVNLVSYTCFSQIQLCKSLCLSMRIHPLQFVMCPPQDQLGFCYLDWLFPKTNKQFLTWSRLPLSQKTQPNKILDALKALLFSDK